jgi:hypothetical protein
MADRNKYYLKKYGITAGEYDIMAANGCHVCGKKPKPGGKALHVDHDHRHAKALIIYHKTERWAAEARYLGGIFFGFGRTKSDARKDILRKLKRASVRGVLCWVHNAGLRKFQDNPSFLAAASEYLKRHQNWAERYSPAIRYTPAHT